MRIIIFGDSIARGAFDEKQGGWVERIKAHFMIGGQEEYEHGVYNFSISGTQSRKVLEGIDFQLEYLNKVNPYDKSDSLIIFAIGTNDASYIDAPENIEVPIDEFEENMKKNIEIAKRYSDNILVLGSLYVDEAVTMPVSRYDDGSLYFNNTLFISYDEVLNKLSDMYGCRYCGMQSIIGNEDLDDGCHPNTQGHEKIARKVLEQIEKFL